MGTLKNKNFTFLCKIATIPPSTLGVVEVPYFGRMVNYAGNRTFAGATNREFIYTVTFSDGLNPTVFKNISVEVQNEYPHPYHSLFAYSITNQAHFH